jgi:hypothetical protein
MVRLTCNKHNLAFGKNSHGAAYLVHARVRNTNAVLDQHALVKCSILVVRTSNLNFKDKK